MTYTLTSTRNAHYLHAVVTGANTLDNVLGYLREVTALCREEDCPYLLIEERLDGPRQDMAAVFEIASSASDASDWQFLAVAYVDVNAQGSLMAFAETVAINRAIPVRVFAGLDEAREWLLSAC